MYSAQLLDHFQNPRHAGDVPDPDASAEVENPVCGDVLRLTLKVHDRQIAKVGFKAKGCVPVMACGSALSEMVCGKTVLQARETQREDVIAAVGGVPSASTHAAQLAVDALRAALRQIMPGGSPVP
jgi:nitrogen fixation NifU-like protein